MADSRIINLPVAPTFADTDAFLIDASAAGNRQLTGAALKGQLVSLRPFAVSVAGSIFTVSAGSRATRAGVPVVWAGGTVSGPVVAGTTWLRHTSSNTLSFAAAYETLAADDLVLGRVVTTGAGVSYVFVPFEKSGGDMLNANNLLNLSDKSLSRTNLKVQSTVTVGTAITGAGNTPITVLDTTMNGFISYAVSAGVGGVAYTRTVSIAAIAFEPTIGAQLTLQFSLPGSVSGAATIEIRRETSAGTLLYSMTSGTVARVETVILRAQTDGSWMLISAGPTPHAGDARLLEVMNTRAPAGAIRFDGTQSRFADSLLRGVSIGTGDYSVVVTFRMTEPSRLVDASNVNLFALGESGATDNARLSGHFFNRLTFLSLVQRDGSGALGTQGTVNLAQFVGRTIQLALTRRAGVMFAFVDGAPHPVTPPGNAALAIGGANTTFSLGSDQRGGNWSYPDNIYSAQVYNRALGAPELRQLAANGVAAEDRNATGELIVNGDFSSATGWTLAAGSVVGGGVLTTTAAVAGSAARQVVSTSVVGRRVRYSLNATITAGTFRAVLGSSGTTIPLVNGLNAVEVVWAGTDGNFHTVWGVDASNSGTFDDASLVQLGCLVDIDCGAGSGFSLPDIQGRFPCVVAPTAYANFQHVRPSRRGQFLAYVNTTGNTQIAGLPVNARITSMVADAAGVVTASVGNASAGSQIVASIALAAGRQDLTLVSRYTSTQNLWVNLSAAVAVTLTVSYEIIS